MILCHYEFERQSLALESWSEFYRHQRERTQRGFKDCFDPWLEHNQQGKKRRIQCNPHAMMHALALFNLRLLGVMEARRSPLAGLSGEAAIQNAQSWFDSNSSQLFKMNFIRPRSSQGVSPNERQSTHNETVPLGTHPDNAEAETAFPLRREVSVWDVGTSAA